MDLIFTTSRDIEKSILGHLHNHDNIENSDICSLATIKFSNVSETVKVSNSNSSCFLCHVVLLFFFSSKDAFMQNPFGCRKLKPNPYSRSYRICICRFRIICRTQISSTPPQPTITATTTRAHWWQMRKVSNFIFSIALTMVAVSDHCVL